MNTYDGSPAAAAWALTAFARFPVEAQAIVSKPSSCARASATETTRSLNECVGFAVSFLIQSSLIPSLWARRSARTSGVQPVGSADRATSTGRKSAYRHSVWGPAWMRRRSSSGLAEGAE
jgi:hypothetical protein